jgi:hypothetical protein
MSSQSRRPHFAGRHNKAQTVTGYDTVYFTTLLHIMIAHEFNDDTWVHFTYMNPATNKKSVHWGKTQNGGI